MLKRSLLILLVFYLYGCHSDAGVNVGLHCSYTFQPQPNYSLCKDSSDIVQLTDGKSYGSYWTKKSTVGWSRASTGIEIVIDLKRISSVDTVKVHSVGGGRSEVEFPEFIAVLVSDDGREFGFTGLLTSEHLEKQSASGSRRIPHTFVIDKLNTQGRFVKVIVRPKGHLFFLDEIEIVEEKGISISQKDRRTNLLKFSDPEALLVSIEDYLQLNDNIVEAVDFLKLNRERFSKEFYGSISKRLDEMADLCSIPSTRIYSKQGLVLQTKQIQILRAEIYFKLYKKPIMLIAANPMVRLGAKDMHLANQNAKARIEMEMCQGETESAAVNVINCSQEPLSILASVSPVADSEGKINNNRRAFTVRRSVFTKALGVGMVGDALVLQPEKPFVLHPGDTTQIWLSLFDPSLKAGTYTASVAFLVSGNKEAGSLTEIMPIEIEIQPIVFPGQVALNTCNWAYPTLTGATKGNPGEAIEDLKKHHTNVILIAPQDLPIPRRISPYGDLIGPMDYKRLDLLLDNAKYVRTWLIYCAFKRDAYKKRFGEWLSPEWKRAFSSWLIDLVRHLKAKGISYDSFALYPFDEKLGDEFYDIAGLINRTDPKIRIYCNSPGKGPKDYRRFKNLIDIWCLHEKRIVDHPDWFDEIGKYDSQTWMYTGFTPGKASDPYGYLRLMPWRAFNRKLTGAGFWAYLDFGTKSWDDTMRASGYYGVVYGAKYSSRETHGEGIVPSRRWEAWREGVEDYQYLFELNKAIASMEISHPQKASMARKLLDQQVDNVMRNPNDYDAVYNARRILSKYMLELKSQ